MRISHPLLIAASACVLAGTVLGWIMARALTNRGQRVSWIGLAGRSGLLYLPLVAERYRITTTGERGRPGPLFLPFLVAMILAPTLFLLSVLLVNPF